MDDVEEKRVFDDRAGAAELLVAGGLGAVSVAVSAGNVGRFGVLERCSPRDVAAADGLVAVATDGDVLLRGPAEEDFGSTGFGPAVAVAVDDGRVVAAAPDGRVASLDRARRGGDGWNDLGTVEAAIRAIDGDLLAAADGLHRLPGLGYVGLDDAHDVAAAGPLAATAGGLYSLGNGWMDALEGDFQVAASDGERAHAATADRFYGRDGGEWHAIEVPVDGRVVDVAYGQATYAVTAAGDLLSKAEDGWVATPLGVEGVVGCAVV